MKVYFTPCGVALGHAGRCLPIAKEIVKKKGKILFSTYGDAVDFLRAENVPTVKMPEIKFEENKDGAVDLKRTATKVTKHVHTFLRQITTEIKLLKTFNPDIVVSDSRLSPLIACRLLGKPSILLLHQLKMLIPHRRILSKLEQKLKHFGEFIIMYTLYPWWSLANIILIPDFPPPYTIAKENLKIPKKILENKAKLIGPIISKRPEELPPSQELKSKLGFNKNKPLIYAGMGGTKKEKYLINTILERIFKKFPGNYQIVFTRGYPNKPEVAYKKENLHVYNWFKDRYVLLKACDIIISRAGHNTVAEAIYFGKPLILVPTPAHSEHQGNAKSAQKMGIAKVIQQENLNLKTLLEAIEEIMNNGYILRNVRRAQQFALKINAIKTVLQYIKLFTAKDFHHEDNFSNKML